MTTRLKSLRFWRRDKARPADTTTAQHVAQSTDTRHVPALSEKPRLQAQPKTLPPPAERGIPVRPSVNPQYSAYSTPVDTRWVDSAAATATGTAPAKSPNATGDVTKPKDEGADQEDVARRRKAEQEEQERRDFFQML